MRLGLDSEQLDDTAGTSESLSRTEITPRPETEARSNCDWTNRLIYRKKGPIHPFWGGDSFVQVLLQVGSTDNSINKAKLIIGPAGMVLLLPRPAVRQQRRNIRNCRSGGAACMLYVAGWSDGTRSNMTDSLLHRLKQQANIGVPGSATA